MEPSRPPTVPVGLPRLLTADDVAKWLSITRRRARALMARGSLPSIRIGRCWYARAEDLEAHLESLLAEEARIRRRPSRPPVVPGAPSNTREARIEYMAARIEAGEPAIPKSTRRD